MQYLNYILLLASGLVIRLLSPVWYWVIILFRNSARIAVHSYIKKNRIFLKDFNINKMYLLTKVSYIKYFLYKWLVWIWLNDRYSNDTIDADTIWRYIMRNYTLNKNTIKQLSIDVNNIGATDRNNLTSLYLINNNINNFKLPYLTLLLKPSNNFENMYYVTNTKQFYFKIHNYEFGWKVNNDTLGGISYRICFFRPLIDDVK